MSEYRCIAPDTAITLLEQGARIVDIRDPASYHSGHIAGATHLDNQSVTDFIAAADLDQPTIVCCYHGHSSQGAAAYLVSQGFADVYSLDGGFELWRTTFPERTSQG